MKPTIGRIVHYRLSVEDIKWIKEWRKSRVGSMRDHEVGQVLPMLIVRVHGDHSNAAVNGQVFLDGDDTLHVVSRLVGDVPGTYAWPWPATPPAQPVGVSYGDRV